VVAVAEEAHGAALEVVDELGDLVQRAQGGESGLLADVGVARAEAPLNLGDEVARHLLGGDVGERGERERDGRGGRVVHVAASGRAVVSMQLGLVRERERGEEDALLERVGDEGEDLLVLVEEEHDAEVPEALVGEAGRGDELEALDLAKVRRVAEHVDVEELGDIVVPGERVCEGGQRGRAASAVVDLGVCAQCLCSLKRAACGHESRSATAHSAGARTSRRHGLAGATGTPTRVARAGEGGLTFFLEAGADGGRLFDDEGALVCDRLGRADGLDEGLEVVVEHGCWRDCGRSVALLCSAQVCTAGVDEKRGLRVSERRGRGSGASRRGEGEESAPGLRRVQVASR